MSTRNIHFAAHFKTKSHRELTALAEQWFDLEQTSVTVRQHADPSPFTVGEKLRQQRIQYLTCIKLLGFGVFFLLLLNS